MVEQRPFVIQAMNKQTKTKQTLEEPVIAGAEKPAKRQRHPNSLANLKPFLPGQSGNPSGRKPNQPLISPRIRRLMEMSWAEIDAMGRDMKKNPSKYTGADVLAYQEFMTALDREDLNGLKARHHIWEREDPVPKADTNVQVNVAVPIALSWHDGSTA